ncbi:hypothetical protein [Geodermatophilus normandii]|uniref:hypothetical protein n=1 Tax=Geodermatophilus normandii TaxID=1137989 RepID=UPI000D70B9A0|nr:hypothetical protein [Geodermatophilus normandii]
MAALCLASCSGEPDDSSASSGSATAGSAAVSQDVAPDQPLELTIDGVAQLTAPAGAFTGPTRVTLTPQPATAAATADVPGTTVAGPGVDVTFDGPAPVQPLRLVLTDVSDQPSADAIPVVLHQRHDGTWETELGEFTPDGGIAVEATEFSSRWTAWLSAPADWVRNALSAVADSLVDAVGGRTDPPACADDGPAWAAQASTTTTVHDCLITNTDPDSGRVRAELQLAPNRRYYVGVHVPEGVEYTWVQEQPAALRAALGRMFGFDPDRQVYIGPGTMTTSGAVQPAADTTLTFTAAVDGTSAALSFTVAVLGLAADVPRVFGGQAVDPRGGLLAAAMVTLACADKIPARWSDPNQTYEFFRCVLGAALSNLEDTDKAFSAAVQQFGDRAYAQEAEDALSTRATVLRVFGTAVKVVSLGAAVRDIWLNVVEAFTQMTDERAGQVRLDLRGRSASPTGAADPHVVRSTGIGELNVNMTVDDLESLGYVDQGNLYEDVDASCVRYAKPDGPLSAAVDTATDRVVAVHATEGSHTEVGGIAAGSTLAQVRSAFAGDGYRITELLDSDFGQGSNGVVVTGHGGAIGLGLTYATADEYAAGTATVDWVAGVGDVGNAPTRAETGC